MNNMINDTTQILNFSKYVKHEHYLKLTESITTISQSLDDASLKVLAGSIILLLGSDYVKPIHSRAKLIYLLFIPAWVSLGMEFFYCNAVCRISASLIQFNNLDIIKSLIYDNDGVSDMYQKQSMSFSFGILFLSIWLTSFLIWWIFFDKQTKHK